MGEETLETANLDNYLKGLCFKQEQEMWQGLQGTVVEKGEVFFFNLKFFFSYSLVSYKIF